MAKLMTAVDRRYNVHYDFATYHPINELIIPLCVRLDFPNRQHD